MSSDPAPLKPCPISSKVSVAMAILSHLEHAQSPHYVQTVLGTESQAGRPLSAMEESVKNAALFTLLEYLRDADSTEIPALPTPPEAPDSPTTPVPVP